MADAEVLEQVIDRIGDLPAMPATVAEVLQLTDDPNVEMEDVSRAIEDDPALTAKILQVSNSSYYGMRKHVGTLKLALVILGVREVRNIVLGVSVFDSLTGDGTDTKLAQEIWDEALSVAGLARLITGEMQLGLQGEEFIAGLLANIGRMILLREFGADYIDMYQELRHHPLKLRDEELGEFGYSHPDAAAALAHKWSLPDALADALWVQYPHPERPLDKIAAARVAAVVRIARVAVTDDFSNPSEALSLQDSEAWQVLASAKQTIPEDQRAVVLKGFVEKVKSAPSLPL
jgi:HD-like signal output (HDOD) protein